MMRKVKEKIWEVPSFSQSFGDSSLRYGLLPFRFLIVVYASQSYRKKTEPYRQ